MQVSLILLLTSIFVKTHADFNRLSARISEALQGKDDVEVIFSPGVYYFQENHLSLQNLQYPDQKVVIRCDGAVFLPAGNGPVEWTDVYIDPVTLRSFSHLSEVKQVLRRPEIVDAKTGLCRVKTREKPLSSAKAHGKKLILTQWYTSGVYDLLKIERNYLYFKADRVTSDGNPQFDPDSDYKYGRVLPRYVLADVSALPEGLHRGTASRFLTVSASNLKAFSLSGGHFIGNGGKDCLIQFYRCTADSISVSQCRFDHIHGPVVQTQYSSHLRFHGNRVSHCWRSGVTIDYFSSDAVVADNSFEQTGELMMQDFAVLARGSDFDIRNNLFCDFAYSAVGVGTHYRESIPASSSGFVRDNELYCSDGFNRGLMDSGAIYVYTINKDVSIIGNYIHDIGGYGDNRGIFCDDGTVNVSILNNRILRIRNSYCIDLRRVASVEKDPRSAIRKVNVGNRMEGNVIDGRVRFVNRDE